MSGSANPFYDPPSGLASNAGAQNIVDSSNAFLGRQAQQPGPAQVIGGFQQVQAQGIANQTAQQTLTAKNAIGQIMQSAIDPTTGEINWSRALTGVAGNPAASFLAPQFISDAIANQKVSADTAQTTLSNALTHYKALTDLVAPLTAEDNPTQDQARELIGNGLSAGILDKDSAMSMLGNLAPDGPALAKQIRMISQSAQGATTTLGQTLGQIDWQNLGGQEVPVHTPGIANADAQQGGQMGPGIANTPTPGEQNQLVPVQQPDGTTLLVPRARAAQMVNGSGQPVGGAPAAAMGQLSDQDKEILGPYQNSLNTRAQTALVANQGLQEMDKLDSEFTAGAGSGVWAAAAKAAQAAGMPKSVVDQIGNGNLSAYQQFSKLQRLNALQTLKATAGAGNPISTEEYNSIQSVLLDPNASPETLKGISQWMQKVNAVSVAEQQSFARYKKAGLPPNQWPAIWNQIQQKSGIVKQVAPPDLSGDASATNVGPAPSNNGQGSPEGTLPAGITP